MISQVPEIAPCAWGYIRCSHEDSKFTGYGMDVQEQAVNAWVSLLKTSIPNLELRDIFRDEVVSAWKVPFLKRPGGKLLDETIAPGDHVIFSRFDRAFRQVKDFLQVYERWRSRGITIHFVDLKIDMDSAAGRFMMTVIAAVAEMEAHRTSERNKEVASRNRERFFPRNQQVPYGFRRVGVKGARRDIPCEKERAIMQEIVRLHDRNGMGFREISRNIRFRLRQFYGDNCFSVEKGKRKSKRGWGVTAVYHAYYAEKELQRAESYRAKRDRFASIKSAKPTGVPESMRDAELLERKLGELRDDDGPVYGQRG